MSFAIQNLTINEAIDATLVYLENNGTPNAVSPFIVGPFCTYSTIQSAINAAHARAAPADVFVLPGTYTENLVLYDGITLAGFAQSERDINNAPQANNVSIVGAITLAADVSVCAIQNVSLSTSGSTLIDVLGENATLNLNSVNIDCVGVVSILTSSTPITYAFSFNMTNCAIYTSGELYDFSSPTLNVVIRNSSINTALKSVSDGLAMMVYESKIVATIETTGSFNNVEVYNSTLNKSSGETNVIHFNISSFIGLSTFKFYSCVISGVVQTSNTSGSSRPSFSFYNCMSMPTFNYADSTRVSVIMNECFDATNNRVMSKLYSNFNTGILYTDGQSLSVTNASTVDFFSIDFTAGVSSSMYFTADIQGVNSTDTDATYCNITAFYRYNGTTIVQVGSTDKVLMSSGTGDVSLSTSGNQVFVSVVSPANYSWTAFYQYKFL